MKSCLMCGNDILGQGKKYCSRKCVYKGQVGQKRTYEQRQKIAKANSTPHTDERRMNISISKTILLSDDDKNNINKMINNSYYPHKLIKQECNISCNNAYDRYVKKLIKNDEFNKIEKKRIKGIHTTNKLFFNDDGSKMIRYKIDWLKNNYKKYDREYIVEYLNIGSKEYYISHICKLHFGGIPKYKTVSFHKGKTLPEKIFEKKLNDIGISYEYNKMVYCKNNNKDFWYSVDFVINNRIFIEIQGDFWHGNPKIYNIGDLTGVQRNNINRDKRKKAQIINEYNCLDYYQIWEYDIKNNTKKYNKQLEEIQNVYNRITTNN